MNPTSWRTPEWLLECVRKIGPIILDPCTVSSNPVNARMLCTVAGTFDEYGRHLSDKDGLSSSWLIGNGIVFANPPYSRSESPRWAAKISREAPAVEIVALLPARVGSKWFHNHVFDCAASLCFLRGRPRHLDDDGNAAGSGKFDSVVAYYGDRARLFGRVFGPHGKVVAL